MRKLVDGLRTADGRLVLALVYTGVVLTTLEYFYLTFRVQERLQGGGRVEEISLRAGLTWAAVTTLLFLVVPALLVLLVHRESLSTIGYRLRGWRKHIRIYLALFVCMVPVLFFVARRPDFERIYPFVTAASEDWTTFFWWEVAYLIQFFALESFFRGYLLFSLERKIGWNAVFVMAVPYCMIHYHKPWMEAYAALAAGIILGALALRLRSFYGGALLHGLVALSMDLLASHRVGLF